MNISLAIYPYNFTYFLHRMKHISWPCFILYYVTNSYSPYKVIGIMCIKSFSILAFDVYCNTRFYSQNGGGAIITPTPCISKLQVQSHKHIVQRNMWKRFRNFPMAKIITKTIGINACHFCNCDIHSQKLINDKILNW